MGEKKICYCGTLVTGRKLNAVWHKSQLSWYVQADLPGLLRKAFRAAVAEALASWSAVCNLTFVESATTAADILIGTGTIDGPQGVLAWSELPPANPVHQKYDTGERWRTGAGVGISLPAVAAHELGHALGLEHDPQAGALMAAYYDERILVPQPRDIVRIQAMYGPPVVLPPPTPSPTPPPPAGVSFHVPQAGTYTRIGD